MSQSSYRGVVINGTVVFSNGSRPLIDGTDVIVTPTSPQRGSASALLRAVESAPSVPREWVDELESLIAQGQRAPSRPDLFPDLTRGPEAD